MECRQCEKHVRHVLAEQHHLTNQLRIGMCLSVKDMSYMFFKTSFNQPLGHWDVSAVTKMEGMFSATPFNKSIEIGMFLLLPK